jgi:hypothetical protein
MERDKLIGKKVYGFKFKKVGASPSYNPNMNRYIGKVGIIEYYDSASVKVRFDDEEFWWYPLVFIQEHLVPELTDNYEIC